MIVETQQRYVNHSSDVTHDVAVNHMICENQGTIVSQCKHETHSLYTNQCLTATH